MVLNGGGSGVKTVTSWPDPWLMLVLVDHDFGEERRKRSPAVRPNINAAGCSFRYASIKPENRLVIDCRLDKLISEAVLDGSQYMLHQQYLGSTRSGWLGVDDDFTSQ